MKAPATSLPTATTPVTDKLRQRATAFKNALSARFQTAAAAFHERLAFEKADVATASPATTRAVVLAGYLFPVGQGEAIPLYEGNYVVDATAESALRWRLPEPGSPPTLWLRVERDFVELVDGSAERPSRFHSNDLMPLGHATYLIKIVDPACRISSHVNVDAEGGLR